MPVEIRELIIRARVDSSENTHENESNFEEEYSTAGISANDLNIMISDFIKRQKER